MVWDNAHSVIPTDLWVSTHEYSGLRESSHGLRPSKRMWCFFPTSLSHFHSISNQHEPRPCSPTPSSCGTSDIMYPTKVSPWIRTWFAQSNPIEPRRRDDYWTTRMNSLNSSTGQVMIREMFCVRSERLKFKLHCTVVLCDEAVTCRQEPDLPKRPRGHIEVKTLLKYHLKPRGLADFLLVDFTRSVKLSDSQQVCSSSNCNFSH